MPIEPDTKDWTWVLQRPCPDCGLDTRREPPPWTRDWPGSSDRAPTVGSTRGDLRGQQVPDLLLRNLLAWRDVFAGGRDLRARPAPSVWSPLEYGCHARDVFALFSERLRLMLTEDDPLYPNWDQERDGG